MWLRIILFVSTAFAGAVLAEETVCTINGKKVLNVVSEKFISVTIDPAVLLTGLNISSTSANLAHHLSPAYIRIGGASTQFLEYTEDEKVSMDVDPESQTLIISPAMWAAVNDWLVGTNLTPIFSINDNDRINGVWNSKKLYPLFDFSDKLNISSYWQLGYDCSNKTEQEYKDDLITLNHLLKTFPEKKDLWKILGSDFSRCLHPETGKDIINELENIVSAVMWEPNTLDIDGFSANSDIYAFPENTWEGKPLPIIRLKVPVWTTVPKSPNPISYSDSLLWGKQIGEAAKSGFEVIFRQPRLRELCSETPIYWVTLLHKHLMGRNVLDIKPSINSNLDTHIYAHCTRKQNSFSRRGAMTIFVVNNGSYEHTTAVKLPLPQLKNVEVQSYILSSLNENSTDVYLNGNKLSIKDLDNEEMLLIPKLRRAHVTTHLTLSLPPKSIGFFVVPSARIPICINSESEMDALIDEIHEDQNISFSAEKSTELQSRFAENSKYTTLNDLYKMMEKELQADETYYRKMSEKNENDKLDWKKLLLQRVREAKKKNNFQPETEPAPKLDKTTNEMRQRLIGSVKTLDKHKKILESAQKKVELKHLLMGRSKELEKKKESKIALLEDLTSKEITKILSDREKAKQAEKFHLTSTEFDDIVAMASKRYRKTRSARLGHRSNKGKKRPRRDINMELLRLQTEGAENDMNVKETEKVQPTESTNIFTEIEKSLKLPKNKYPFWMKSTTAKPVKVHEKDSLESLEFKIASENFDSVMNDDLDDHGFYENVANGFKEIKSKPSNKELFEADLFGNGLGEDDFTIKDDIEAYLSKMKPSYKHESEELDKTKKTLADYFKLTSNTKPSDFDVSMDSFYDDKEEPMRFKRALPSNSYFVSYEKFPRPFVRRSRSQQEPKVKPFSLNIFQDNALSNLIQPKSSSPFVFSHDHIVEPLETVKNDFKEHLEKIKERAEARRKIMEDRHVEWREKLDEARASIDEMRKSRLRRSTYNAEYDETYIPKAELQNNIIMKYKSMKLAMKKWKPEDILTLGESKKSSMTRVRKSIADDVDSVENRIDSNDNRIVKGKHPKTDIFAKSISVKQNQGETEIKITNNFPEEVESKKASNHLAVTTATPADIVTVNDDEMCNASLFSYDDQSSSSNPKKYSHTHEHIQKIGLNIQPNVLERVFSSFGDFVSDMHKKMSSYFYMVD